MKTWASYCGGLLVAGGLASGASGQVPAIPAAPAAAAGAAAPPAAAAAGQAAAAPHKLKTFFEGCKEKFCSSPFGALVTNSTQPLNALTGGILGNCCPQGPTAADLAKPPTSAQGAAARIAKDTAEAKARRAAVRYLGTVDCHYWPEAEAGLINALRADRNECVRLEAALSLGRGCCCTKNIIEALSICVAESDRDNNPSENSDRVKAAAQYALEHCLARLCVAVEAAPGAVEKPRETAPKEGPSEKPPARSGDTGKEDALLSPYYRQLHAKSMKDVIEQARKAIAKSETMPAPLAMHRDRPHSVTEIITQAVNESITPDRAAGYVAQPRPQLAPTAAPPTAITAQPAPRNPEPVVNKPVMPVVNKPVMQASQPAVTVRPSAPVVDKPVVVTPRPSEVTRAVTEPGPVVRPMMNEPSRPTMPAPVAPRPLTTEAPRPLPQTVEAPRTPLRSVETPQPPMRTVEAPRAPVRNMESPMPTAQPGIVRPATFQPTPVPTRPATAPSSLPQPAPSSPGVSGRPLLPAMGKPDIQVASVTPPPASPVQGVRVQQAVQALRTSTYPEHREWAAGQLGSSELRSNGQVIPALVVGAREDKDAAVRCACVRALGKMNAQTPAVIAALQMLKSDTDLRVRNEVGHVLAKFGLGPSGFAEQAEPRTGLR